MSEHKPVMPSSPHETNRRKWLARGVPALALVSALTIAATYAGRPSAPAVVPEEQTLTQPSTSTSQETSAPTTTTTSIATNGGARRNTPPPTTVDSPSSTVATPAVPAFTRELRNGQPLEEFPFTIMTEPPHSVHDPVTDFAAVSNNDGSYIFTLPEVTNDIGLYGRFWLAPTPPAPNALLAGIRLTDASWSGAMDNSLVVFSLLDRRTENNALGTVTGATQGLPGELVAVLFDQTADVIELRLTTPVANADQVIVFAGDSENLPTGNPTTYPETIALGGAQWLWTTAQ